jgi:galactokinase
MHEDPAALKAQFAERFGGGGRVHVIRAPGRVNLIGEHTDYNQGLVFPLAIEPHVLMVCRSREDGLVRLASTRFPEDRIEFSVQSKVTPTQPPWGNYSRGVAAGMLGAGIPLTGMDALLGGTLPMGGGLASSAAISVATAQAFLTLSGLKMDPSRMALLCQKAEHDFAGVPVGIMDQTIIASAKAGHAMLLDCRNLSRQFVPIDDRDLSVLIVNSMVKRSLCAGEFAARRRDCERAVAILREDSGSTGSLRDVTLKQVEAAHDRLGETLFRRCRHVVTENARTVEASTALGRRHYERLGELMYQSHASLRDDYDVSAPELDFLVEQMTNFKGVYGSRMTGAGFGGCTVSLVQPRALQAVTEHIRIAFEGRFSKIPDILATSATAGVSVLE